MSLVNLQNVVVLDNPTAFTNPFQFEVTFECLQALEDDLEWKITYVGSAENECNDQQLEEVLVGPVPVGTNKFVFQANAPNPELISKDDLVGVTIVLVTCSYREKEFVRVGYYVSNEYTDPELIENPPDKVDVTKLQRNILADKPRVTRFPIDWNPSGSAPADPVIIESISNGETMEEEMEMDVGELDLDEEEEEEEEDDDESEVEVEDDLEDENGMELDQCEAGPGSMMGMNVGVSAAGPSIIQEGH